MRIQMNFLTKIFAILVVSVLSTSSVFGSKFADPHALNNFFNSLKKSHEIHCASFNCNETGCISEKSCVWNNTDEKCSADRTNDKRDALILMGIFLGYTAASVGFVYLSIQGLSYFIGGGAAPLGIAYTAPAA